MNARQTIACAALVLALLVPASACSLLDSGSDLPPVSSFHYTQTVATTIDGETTTGLSEGYYRAPDAVRVVSDAESPYLEMIVIGSQAWTRRSNGWCVQDRDTVAAIAFGNSYAILGWREAKGLDEVGSGPATMGERTRRYRFVDENYGDRMTETLKHIIGLSTERADLLAPLKDEYKGQSAEMELMIGDETRFLYSVTLTLTGPNLSERTHMVVDGYNGPVKIEPPDGAEDLLERTEAGTCD